MYDSSNQKQKIGVCAGATTLFEKGQFRKQNRALREGEFRRQQPGFARMYCARMDIKPKRRPQKYRECRASRFRAGRGFTSTIRNDIPFSHSANIVDFRSAGRLPHVFKYRYALRAKYFGSRVFFSVWRPVWTASALDNWQIRYSAPKMEGIIIRSAHRR